MWRGRVKRCSDTLRLGAQLVRYNLYGPGTQLSQSLSMRAYKPELASAHVCQVSLISQWILVGTCMGLNFFEVPQWVVILALFWYLHGWIFPTGTCMGGQKLYTVVHGWAWPHIPWYMDGSLFLQNWYMDGWWVVALQNSQRHTPTQTKVEYPPRGLALLRIQCTSYKLWVVEWVALIRFLFGICHYYIINQH